MNQGKNSDMGEAGIKTGHKILASFIDCPIADRVFLQRKLWIVNCYINNSSKYLSNENIKTGVSREIWHNNWQFIIDLANVILVIRIYHQYLAYPKDSRNHPTKPFGCKTLSEIVFLICRVQIVNGINFSFFLTF